MGQSLSVNNRMIETFDTAMESGKVTIVELVPALPPSRSSTDGYHKTQFTFPTV